MTSPTPPIAGQTTRATQSGGNGARTASPVIRSKTDQRYWLGRVEKRQRKINGATISEPDFSVQMSHAAKQRRIKLATANKDEAAARATSFYRSLVVGGWDAAYGKHPFADTGRRAESSPSPATEAPADTLGVLFAAYATVAMPRTSTLACYKKAARRIFAAIAGTDGGERFKTAGNGNREWKSKVDDLPLSTVTVENLQEWKRKQVQDGGGTLDERRARTTTVNSLLRNCRALFAKRFRKQLSKLVALPDPNPFDEITLESAPPTRYRSRIDARAILECADAELRATSPEVYVALNLALRAGLRRREIDSLMWASVDLERRVLHLEPNEFYELKSRDSAGEVDISDELTAILVAFRKAHRGETFVIPTPSKTRARTNKAAALESAGFRPPAAPTESYRCAKVFEELSAWLRAHGVHSKRPIHELRKEIGSLIAAEHGIFAASRFLRHSDIRITASTYLDKKKRIVSPV